MEIYVETNAGRVRRQFQSLRDMDRQVQRNQKISLNGTSFVKFKKLRPEIELRLMKENQSTGNESDFDRSVPLDSITSNAEPDLRPSEPDFPLEGSGSSETITAPSTDRATVPGTIKLIDASAFAPESVVRKVALPAGDPPKQKTVGPSRDQREQHLLKLEARIDKEAATVSALELEVKRLREAPAVELRAEFDTFLEEINQKLARVTRQQQITLAVADEFIENVDQFQPGKVIILNQQLDVYKQEVQSHVETIKELKNRIDDVERENRRLAMAPENLDRQQLESERQLYRDLPSRLQMQDRLRELERELEDFRHRAEIQSVIVSETARDEEARRSAERLRYENQSLIAELSQTRATNEQLRENLALVQQGRRASLQQLSEQSKSASEIEVKLAEALRKVALHELRETEQETREQKFARDSVDRTEHFRIREEESKTRIDQELQSAKVALEASYDAEAIVLRADLNAESKRLKAQLSFELAERIRALEASSMSAEKDLLAATVERDGWRSKHDEMLDVYLKWKGEEALRKEQAYLAAQELRHFEERRGQLQREIASLTSEYKVSIDELESRKRERSFVLEDELSHLRASREALTEEVALIAAQIDAIKHDRGLAEERLKELIEERSKLENVSVERSERIASIQAPIFDIGGKAEWQPDEMDWLNEINSAMERVDFTFPRRLLYAFHTSLKIALWSPLTVLAGVSGTGKSELPRLYANFGGLRFVPVPVQPNWDSPQDLLGFFNYVDGRYKATDLLRALVQSQRENYEYGFSDGLLLILLDELNLARIELYFSELLSRLELRRGSVSDLLQHLYIDIGAGEKPYPVRLGDNVLYAGTMNDDETTHSISDKVLDRGSVISFPRPRSLNRRDLKSIEPSPQFLTKNCWNGWMRAPKDVLSEDIRDGILSTLQNLNRALSLADRAIGHRVFQATEQYIANHPLVCEAARNSPDKMIRLSDQRWRVALEDQIAQKIMPKLKGIEVSSVDCSNCLDAVARELGTSANGLMKDFSNERDRAAKGQGSFVWSNAEYLSRMDAE